MKVSLIVAHPNPESFNHAIANAVDAELRVLGHQIRRHDLCQEQFNAAMPAAELANNAPLGSVIRQHCYEIVGSEGIIIIHPNWWGMPPAILTGWIDRVLRVDVAYRLAPNEQGELVPQGLLRSRAVLIFNTSNTPEARELELYGDPLETLWKKCIFGQCGVKNVHRRSFGSVAASTPEQRTQWLAEVRKLVSAQLPAEKRVQPAGMARPFTIPLNTRLSA